MAWARFGPFAWADEPRGWSPALACTAVGLALLAMIAPAALAPLRRSAHALERGLFVATSWLALHVIYFGVLTPTGWISRWLGRDPLQLRADSRANTYWRPHRPRDKQSYFHQS